MLLVAAEDALTAEDEEWLTKVRAQTWRQFDNPEAEPEWSMVTKEMLDELDEVNEKWWDQDKARLMFMDSPGYWDDVKEVLNNHVVRTDPDDERGRLVRDNIIKKFRWYKNEAGIEWHRLRIPILTPKLLDALAANIGAIAQGYEEVSHFVITFSNAP